MASDETEEEENTQAPTLDQRNYFLFTKEMNESSCTELMKFILERNLITEESKRPDAIRVIITSPGGILSSTFALISIIEASRIPIYTYAFGEIASAAVMLFMAGAKGHRYICNNAFVMSHQYSGSSYGKEHELYACQKAFKLESQRVLNHYKKYTKQSESTIKKYLLPPEDVYLTPKEAVKFGIADKIINTLK